MTNLFVVSYSNVGLNYEYPNFLERYGKNGVRVFLRGGVALMQSETMKEKRMRAVHFSKAGLEVPDNDRPLERKSDGTTAGGTEPEIDKVPSRQHVDEDGSVQPMLLEIEAVKNASETDEIISKQDLNKDDSLQPTMLERGALDNGSVSLDFSQGAACCIEKSGSVCLILSFCFPL